MAAKHLKKLQDKIGKSVNEERWKAMDTLRSALFPAPKGGFIVVRIITHTHMEMTAVSDVGERLGDAC